MPAFAGMTALAGGRPQGTPLPRHPRASGGPPIRKVVTPAQAGVHTPATKNGYSRSQWPGRQPLVECGTLVPQAAPEDGAVRTRGVEQKSQICCLSDCGPRLLARFDLHRKYAYNSLAALSD